MSKKKNKQPQTRLPSVSISNPALNFLQGKLNENKKINIAAWAATPYVITGFGVVMKEILQGLYKKYPGTYDIFQVGINFHGDYCDELFITGGIQNGRFRQWPAKVDMPGGVNLYGQPKFIDLLRNLPLQDIDAIFLFEDPFWVGGNIPGINPPISFLQAIRNELSSKGMSHIPIVSYFPIDGIPDPYWVNNIATIDIPITYLNFGYDSCVKLNPTLKDKLRVIPHGVNTKEFYPIPQHELRTFKRAMFGDQFVDKYMVLNVNRNQLRKMIPSNLLAFKKFKEIVPNSFMFLNMRPVDVGWNLYSACQSLGLEVGRDVCFPQEFNVQKGLDIQDLNKLFNAADLLTTTAVGGGWELSISQAFATKTAVLAPENTSHTELCGDQTDINSQRGVLFKSGSSLAQLTMFPHDNEVIRPLPDLDDMVQKMIFMHNNPNFCRQIEENAYKWTLNTLSWERDIVPKFHKAFIDAKDLKGKRLAEIQQKRAEASQKLINNPTA